VIGLSDPEASADIVEACRRGDPDAFRALYEVYKDKVYSIALYFFNGDPSAAGDVTQQVFLKLICGISKFRGESGFSTWLYRLVVNTCMDSARQAKPRVAINDVPLQAQSSNQEEEISREQTARSVQAALSGLPPKLRLPVLLRYFEDLSYAEMASAMNCSMGTVASRLSRGHKLLARELGWLRK